ncbi:hypothetical protein P775_19775 [Puniceibacterium antarcticum]|uniref:Uncharacterized protein n=1 Tax=Puniceibacterium antarcticum TaxID=1206336 RepID=A0A2G8RB82_9RHOB|nr:hypothetical protein [Puniceibacterium antarcticum]PIL18810.1 hypothetical protein P775_19775 [Puniceibacterium antarcticum]
MLSSGSTRWLSMHPGLPCAAAGFDADWPATMPIWADVAGSGLYYLAAPDGTGYDALPAACTALKSALAIRERLQLPGVLQAMAPPPDLGRPRVVLGCGSGTAAPAEPDAVAGGPGAWSLHRFEVFLTENSTGDTLYVARYQPPGEGAVPPGRCSAV